MFLVAGERAAGIDDHRRKGDLIGFRHPLQHLVAAQIRQAQIEHQAVEGRLFQPLERFGSRGDIRNLHPVAGEQLPDTVTLALVVLDDQNSPDALLELGFEPLES